MDPLLKKMLQQAETLYQPKKILTNGDWLWGQKERPQTFNLYNRPTVRNEVTQQRNKIYLFVVDDQIKPEFLEKLIKYCAAFYTGMQIEIKYPEGGPMDGKRFMNQLGVKSRELYTDHTQFYTGDILNKTIPLVPKDAYCMLTITMQDLCPGKDWVFCYGWAMYRARTGVFSFMRYDPSGDFCYTKSDDPET